MAKLVLPTSLFCSIVQNTLPGTDGYHLAVSHLGSRDENFVYEHAAAKLPGQTPIGAKLVWESLIETVTEAMTEHQYRASVNGVSFELAIPGSTTAINGEPTEGAYVSISPSSAIRNAAADVSLVYSSSEMDAPTVKSVENLESHESGEIAGTESFRVVGSNITAAGDDESLKVVAADGTEAVVEVTGEDGYGMFITARLATALPPGKGKVVLKTHGKRTPEGELRTLVKSVTILAGEPTPPVPAPVIASATSEALEEDHVVADGETMTYIVGENLDPGSGGAEVVLEDGEGSRVGHGTGNWSEASSSLEVTLERDGDPATETGTIKVTISGTTATHAVTVA